MNQQLCSRSKFSQLQQHKEKWSGCQDCSLHSSSTQKVFYRGNIPCDVLFISDAPSTDDDNLGFPFSGGNLTDTLNYVIVNGLSGSCLNLFASKKRVVTYAIATAVLCSPPLLENSFESQRDPEKDELKACSGRLAQFAALAEPKLVVNVGKLAEKAVLLMMMETDVYYRTLNIPAPGFMVRKEDPQLEKERAVLQLQQAIANIFGKG